MLRMTTTHRKVITIILIICVIFVKGDKTFDWTQGFGYVPDTTPVDSTPSIDIITQIRAAVTTNAKVCD